MVLYLSNLLAGMAELADAPDLESGVSRREGSSPFTRTKFRIHILIMNPFFAF